MKGEYQMSEKLDQEKKVELDKALTELDVLATKDKSIFRVDAETFRFENVEYKLIENHRDAFDIEMMEERFTDYLFKYDYIVGDIAYEKLRLRGFYEDSRKSVPIDMKISNLEDYLIEYCNFGCQYFVFERVEKNEEDPEPYFTRSKKSNRGRRGRKPRRQNKETSNPSNNRPKRSNQKGSGSRKDKPTGSQSKTRSDQRSNQPQKVQEFKVKKIETETPKSIKQQPKKQQTKTENKKTFKIRKKRIR